MNDTALTAGQIAAMVRDARQEAQAEVLGQVQALITQLAEEQPPLSRMETVLYTLSLRITENI
jgi:hypothetical protein